MSKKDFKEGMVAGAKPFEEKFREVQNAAIASLQKLASEEANKVGELIDISEEHEYLLKYDWKKECQLESLAEKSILAGFLMYAIDEVATEEPTETQRGFLNSIYKFLNLNISGLLSKKIDISHLSNNNDLAFQKLLYLLTCMYFYLESENFKFEKSNPDVFDYFNVSPKDRKDIQGLIEERGKYFNLDSLFVPAAEETEEIEAPAEESDAVGCNLPDGLEEKCFDELYMVKKDCEEVIFDKIINIQSNFHVDGKLTFKNCKINAQESCQINVIDSGILEFDNCDFSELRRTENYLINSKGKVHFNHCSIYNCWKLVKSNGCFDYDSNDIEISKSFIRFDDEFDKVDEYGFFRLDNTLLSGKSISLVESKVEGFITPNGDFLDLGKDVVIFYGIKTCSKCTFNNFRNIFDSNLNITESSFHSCKRVFIGTRNTVVTNCTFFNCSYIFDDLSGTNTIENCKFIDCENQILEVRDYIGGTTSFDACEFRNIKQSVSEESLFYVYPAESKSGLIIKNCVFDNITLAEHGTIVKNGTVHSKIKFFDGEISECTFGKIIRKSKTPVIEVYGSYIGAFDKKHTYYAYSIHNCSGLDGLPFEQIISCRSLFFQ